MSEYQYYEFQALDRPLTQAERGEISQLSSRVVLNSTSAAFTYHYGDFRGKPESVLEKYFDAMLYCQLGIAPVNVSLPKASD